LSPTAELDQLSVTPQEEYQPKKRKIKETQPRLEAAAKFVQTVLSFLLDQDVRR